VANYATFDEGGGVPGVMEERRRGWERISNDSVLETVFQNACSKIALRIPSLIQTYSLEECTMSLKRITTVLFVATLAGSLHAQTVGNQKFTVNVPSNVAITPPANVTITHDQSEANQSFPAQQWVVRGNTLAGVNVSFAVATPFIHTTDSSFKRDVELNLAFNSKQGPATWTVTNATDSTGYAATPIKNFATVNASSNGVGRGTFDLVVKFITDGWGTFAAGSYETTVVGTVAANN
jgi:hypothetical protein